jgi:hypothetical protein
LRARTASGIHVVHSAGRVSGIDTNRYDNLVCIAPVIGRCTTAGPPARRNHLVIDVRVPCGVASRADHANAVEPEARPNPEADDVPAGLAAIDCPSIARRSIGIGRVLGQSVSRRAEEAEC